MPHELHFSTFCQVISERETIQRIKCYRDHAIAFVARPKDGRKGLFKKASNMNYALNVAVQVGKIMAENGVAHDRALAQVDSRAFSVMSLFFLLLFIRKRSRVMFVHTNRWIIVHRLIQQYVFFCLLCSSSPRMAFGQLRVTQS
jgi:hypothetical protein